MAKIIHIKTGEHVWTHVTMEQALAEVEILNADRPGEYKAEEDGIDSIDLTTHDGIPYYDLHLTRGKHYSSAVKAAGDRIRELIATHPDIKFMDFTTDFGARWPSVAPDPQSFAIKVPLKDDGTLDTTNLVTVMQDGELTPEGTKLLNDAFSHGGGQSALVNVPFVAVVKGEDEHIIDHRLKPEPTADINKLEPGVHIFDGIEDIKI